jgi:CBS-domain-containing membrane protein
MSKKTDRLRRQLIIGLMRQFHLERMEKRLPPGMALALFNFFNSGLSIGLIAVIALITKEAFIFPSLGATAFILFYLPRTEVASPRNVLSSHLVGALCGWGVLWMFGLNDAPSAMAAGMDWPHAFSASLSMALTASLMALLRIAHPPAAATSLIVSLGLMPHLNQIPILMTGVLVLLTQAFVLNRLAGIPYPLWALKQSPRKP